MKDPTLQDMLAALGNPADDDVDAYAAIYWFASDWHGGQSSNLYSVLSTSPYKPGMMERGPASVGEGCVDYYNQLHDAFRPIVL